ncbi:MAG: ATP-binding protein [Acidimicrobiia bacterium]|nr:ATP-binding protein [Acidimicrobiia bacterium]
MAVVLVATVGAFSYFLTSSQHQALVSQVEHSAHQISETIKSATKHDMLLNRRERLHLTIDTLGQQDGIEQVRIFNKEGAIIYSSDRSAIGTMVDKRAEACYGCHAADRPLEKLSIPERTRIFKGQEEFRQLGIINPIYNSPDCWQASCHVHDPSQTVLGVLDVTESLAEVDNQLLAHWTQVFLLALTAVLASSFIIWLVFHRLVARPVGRLVQATRTVADGDLDCSVDVTSNDELGHLADCFNDMTQRIAAAQQQLYQSDKLASLGRLAAGVAHEINNPLTGVLTYSSFLLKRAKDAETRDDLETIVRETKRCRQIVRGLLDFSRQARPKKTRVEIADVIGKSLRIVHNRLSFDNISVATRIGAGLPPITADPNQMVQVFINLIVNAADAIGEKGGEISIWANRRDVDGEQVEIIVADTGCGIAKEDIGKVFEPFYTTKELEGTGLGLAVVWGIIDKHGGNIDIQSDPGNGTKVTIRMPAVDKAQLMEEKTA